MASLSSSRFEMFVIFCYYNFCWLPEHLCYSSVFFFGGGSQPDRNLHILLLTVMEAVACATYKSLRMYSSILYQAVVGTQKLLK